VGIISSVPSTTPPRPLITPACQPRPVNSIATQMAQSGYEFFGGGGIVAHPPASRSGDTDNDIWTLLENGYEVRKDRERSWP
jgi:alkaline phosphatase